MPGWAYTEPMSSAELRSRRRERFETAQPGERSRIPARRRMSAYVLAVLLPTSIAAVMIPLRVDHGRAAVLVLVLPVVVVALLGTTGAAVLAATTSVLAYDWLLAAPYYSFAIEDADEIVAAGTLLAVALVVGVLNTRLVRLHARDSARRAELRHLIRFVHTAATTDDPEALTVHACEQLTAVLNLRRCEWNAGSEPPTGGPILMPDGNIMGALDALDADRAVLPQHLAVPVLTNEIRLGRFDLTPTEHHVASFEERVTAVAIAELYGRAVASTVGAVKDS